MLRPTYAIPPRLKARRAVLGLTISLLWIAAPSAWAEESPVATTSAWATRECMIRPARRKEWKKSEKRKGTKETNGGKEREQRNREVNSKKPCRNL